MLELSVTKGGKRGRWTSGSVKIYRGLWDQDLSEETQSLRAWARGERASGETGRVGRTGWWRALSINSKPGDLGPEIAWINVWGEVENILPRFSSWNLFKRNFIMPSWSEKQDHRDMNVGESLWVRHQSEFVYLSEETGRRGGWVCWGVAERKWMPPASRWDYSPAAGLTKWWGK